MDNIAELYATLGVEMPEDEGEKEQEVAAPEETGEEEQEVAAPAASEDGEEPANPAGDEPDKKPQTNEERRANAARRRKQEIDDAVAEALKKEREETNARWKKFLEQAQIKNQHQNGEQIDSLEKAEQWAEQDRMAKLQKNLKNGTLTAQDLQTVMEQSPAFKELQNKQSAQEEAAAKLTAQQFDQSVEVELEQIRKLNPKINNLADILAMETGSKWASYVQNNNMSYLDAYKMANMEQLMEQNQRAAKAESQLRSSGKQHLQPPSARGQGGVEVPKRVKELYRMGRPNMTDAEIEADYRKRAGKA